MKTDIVYSTECYLTLFFNETCDLESASWRDTYPTLQKALNAAQRIFSTVYPHTAERVVICSSYTGEILAECVKEEADTLEAWESFEDDFYPDDDWNYNEDLGYDPYLGCYTDDC